MGGAFGFIFGAKDSLLAPAPYAAPSQYDAGVPRQYSEQTAKCPSRYKETTITVKETSNGVLISVGTVMRVCLPEGNLMEEIAAAYAEHKLQG